MKDLTPEQLTRLEKVLGGALDDMVDEVVSELTPAPTAPAWQDDKGWQGVIARCKEEYQHGGGSPHSNKPCNCPYLINSECIIKNKDLYYPCNWDDRDKPPINPSTITKDCPDGEPYLTLAEWQADQPHDEVAEPTIAEYQEFIRQIRIHLGMKESEGMLEFIDKLTGRGETDQPKPPESLKPCAHCGGEVEVYETPPDRDTWHWRCNKCGVNSCSLYPTRLDCITAANRRPEEPAKQGLSEGTIWQLKQIARYGEDISMKTAYDFSREILDELGIDWRK